MHNKKLITMVLYLVTSFVYAQSGTPTCSRKAIHDNREILIDGYTGIKGSGLNDLMKNHQKAMQHLQRYQNSGEIRTFNLLSGTISTASILTGLLYTGDKTNKSNFLFFGGIVALVNFLTTKTVEFYNERELALAIDEYNKTSEAKIRLINQSQGSPICNI